MSKTKILITGITGQDGIFLTSHLLKREDNLKIFGISRSEKNNIFYKNLNDITGKYNENNLKLIKLDLLNQNDVEKLLIDLKVDKIINLSGPSSVYNSFQNPEDYKNIIINQFNNLVNGCKASNTFPTFFQASSSEMFSNSAQIPLSEHSKMEPRSPYSEAKSALHSKVYELRNNNDWNIKSGVMFNHESEYRLENFLVMKIINTVIDIYSQKTSELIVGSLEYKRDWSYAYDIVKAINLIIDETNPVDYVIGSGTGNTILDMIKYVFEYFNLDYQEYIKVDNTLLREGDPIEIVSDPSLIYNNLGWKTEVTFQNMLVKIIEFKLKTRSK
jgi:GDPmannose 4,6-dehydratase